MKTKIQFAVFALLTVIALAFTCMAIDFAMDQNSNLWASAYIFGCIITACCYFEASALYKECDFKTTWKKVVKWYRRHCNDLCFAVVVVAAIGVIISLSCPLMYASHVHWASTPLRDAVNDASVVSCLASMCVGIIAMLVMLINGIFDVCDDSWLDACDNVGARPVQRSRSTAVWHTLHDMRNASYILEEAFRDWNLYEPAIKQAIEQYEAAELSYIRALNTTGMYEEITDYDKHLVNIERTRFAMYANVPAMKQFVDKYNCSYWIGYLDNKELMNAIINK